MNLFLLKSAGIIALFLIIYKLFLERDTYFKSIRGYFITGIVASIVLPFISVTRYIEAPPVQQIIYSQNFQNLVSTNEVTSFNWSTFLFYIYIIGIALSGLYFIFQIISLAKLLNIKSVKKYNNYSIIETQKDVSPFSFFKYIVYNPNQFNATEIKQLLKHEETHVLQRHSIDMLLAHLLTCVQWFNPFAWFYKKAITQNLEYIADKEAKFTITPKNYSYLLLKTTKPNYQMVLANNFYNSLLKKRIMMLHKNHSPRLKQIKLALVLPLLVGFVFAFNTKVVAQHKQDTESKITKVDIDVFAMQFEKNATKADLDNIKSSFKNKFGFAIKIKNLKRNDKNEITGIKITAKKGKTNAQYATSSSDPIQPIKIAYNGKSDQISISTGKDAHNKNRNYFSYKIENFTGDPQKLIKLQNSLINDKSQNDIIFINSSDTIIHKLKGKNSFVFVSNKDKGKSNASLFTKQRGNVSATWIDDAGNKTDIIEVKEDGNISKIIEIKTDKNGTISKTVRVSTDKNMWNDKDGNVTEIIEVLTDEKPHKLHKKYKMVKNNSKSTWKDKNGNITKVIEVKTDKNGNITKTIKVDSDKKGHKLIIKDIDLDDKDKVIDLDATNNKNAFVFSTSGSESPIFILDGKEIKKEALDKFNIDSIKSISVLKGTKATKKYGSKGKNGVIEITTKKKSKK
jgi:bla regulator protein blaR1